MSKIRLTLENELYGQTLSVEIPDGDVTLHEIVESMVRPVLIAAGYSRGLIDHLVPPNDAGILKPVSEEQ